MDGEASQPTSGMDPSRGWLVVFMRSTAEKQYYKEEAEREMKENRARQERGSWPSQNPVAAPFSGDAVEVRLSERLRNGRLHTRLEAGATHGPSRCYGAQK